MRGHHWYVWDDNDNILCEGPRSKCYVYYKQHGGEKNGLHLGYLIPEDKETRSPNDSSRRKRDHHTAIFIGRKK